MAQATISATAAGSTTERTSQAELNAFMCDSLPPQGCWSEALYLWLTDWTNRLIEFTDGHVELLPMPTVDGMFSWRHFMCWCSSVGCCRIR